MNYSCAIVFLQFVIFNFIGFIMKKIIFALSLALASFTASAALNESFVSSDNKVFSLHNVREVTFPTGSVLLTYAQGDTSGAYLQDVGGGTQAKIKGSAAFTQFVQLGTTGRYFNVKYARYVTCDSQGTNIGWTNAGAQSLNDGCQLFNSIKNVSQ